MDFKFKYVFNTVLFLALEFLLLAAFVLAAPNAEPIGVDLIGFSTVMVSWALTRKLGY